MIAKAQQIGIIVLCVVCSALSAQDDTTQIVNEWRNLIPLIKPDLSLTGEWSKVSNELKVNASNGARITVPVQPSSDYDFEVEFTRQTGKDSIALIFPHGSGQASCEVDAWGQQLTGIQNINGQDIRQNSSRRKGESLRNGQRYKMTVEVRKDYVRCLLDEKEFAIHRSDGSDLSIGEIWKLSHPKQLGIGAWNSETVFHTIRIRTASSTPLMIARDPQPTRPAPKENATPDGKKHVLIVIANQHFFYREYADPRAELEQSGVRVTVAAGERKICRPHQNSGQGNQNGAVRPDLALVDVNVEDYDAILFSGGWGASSYQYAFPGRYSTNSYNGNREIKTQANRLVNEFLSAGKYTCALCNAVSVLAWARIDGESPLKGKKVCAPTRAAAPGIYNGRRAQPSCRWHPEANGAILSPAGAIGRRNSAIDDVLVDGLIITGEDDISAREMGRKIVQVLKAK